MLDSLRPVLKQDLPITNLLLTTMTRDLIQGSVNSFDVLSISAPPRSTQHDEEPLGLSWQFRPSTINNNNTLYHNLLQDLSIMRKTRDRAERQFTQLLLSDGVQKKNPPEKNPWGRKVGRKSG